MEKIAILIVCHKNLDQLKLFLSQFNENLYDIFIHFDKKIPNLFDELRKSFCRKNVFLIPDSERIDVRWGEYSIALAELKLIKYAKQKKDYAFYWLCSGQDLLLKPSKEIYNFLIKNKENNFLSFIAEDPSFVKRMELYYPSWACKNTKFSKILRYFYKFLTGGRNHTFKIFRRKITIKFYFGPQWFCLNHEVINYILNYIELNKDVLNQFKFTLDPDESIIQAIVRTHYQENDFKPIFLYTNWQKNTSNPKVLLAEDFNEIVSSNKFIARKFDIKIDRQIINKILMLTNKDA